MNIEADEPYQLHKSMHVVNDKKLQMSFFIDHPVLYYCQT